MHELSTKQGIKKTIKIFFLLDKFANLFFNACVFRKEKVINKKTGDSFLIQTKKGVSAPLKKRREK